MNRNHQDRIASHLIALGVPMMKRMTGEWFPCRASVSRSVCKINGKVVRASLLDQAQQAGLVA